MYTAQLTIDRIQSLIKEKGFTQKCVLSECGINENTLKRMTDNKGISSFYLAKIADYLNCSVDYLLGRVDKEEPASKIKGEEVELLRKFKILNDIDRKRILKQIDLFLQDYPNDEKEAKNAEIA